MANKSNELLCDEFAHLEMELIFHDPVHRYLTGIAVGHDPTNDNLLKQWVKTDAHTVLSKKFCAEHSTE